VANNEDAYLDAQAHEHEALLVFRVLRIRNHTGILVKEGCPSLFKLDSMFSFVGSALPRILFEAKFSHNDSVIIS